ncbi:MAG: glycosyltransferase, partial [Myxococcota bacterium]
RRETRRQLGRKVPYYRRYATGDTPESPKISVYIPAYNARATLSRAIDSALGQRETDLEVCICDDGSSDETLAMLAATYGDHPRVRWECRPHGGIASASRHAVSMCRGEYILQLDADDELLPAAAGTLAAQLDADPDLALVYGGYEAVDAAGQILRRVIPKAYRALDHLLDQTVSPPRMFRARDYHRTAGFDTALSSAVDFDITLKLAERGRVRQVGDILYRYHLHGDNTSLRAPEAQTHNHLAAVRAAIARRGLRWQVATPDPDHPRVARVRGSLGSVGRPRPQQVPQPRVVQLINGLGRGGGERLMSELVLGLRDRVDTQVFCLTRLGPWADELRAAGIEVRALSWHGVPLPPAWWALLRAARSSDVLHAHFFYSELVAALLAVVGRARLIVTRHETGEWMTLLHRWLDHWLTRRIEHVFCVSQAVHTSATGRGAPANKVSVAYPAFTVAPHIVPLDERRRHILSVGRLEHVKGHDVLLRAWALVAGDPALAGWQLRIVGDGSQRQRLRRLARKLHLEGRCTLVGELTPEAVAREMADACVFVLPSRAEALSLALLEAMAGGLACIASDVGGVREIIKSDGHGLRVAPEDAPTLAQAMQRLTADPNALATLSAAAIERAREFLTTTQPHDLYEATYRAPQRPSD